MIPNVCNLLKADFSSIVASSVLLLFVAFQRFLEPNLSFKLKMASDDRDGFVGTKTS